MLCCQIERCMNNLRPVSCWQYRLFALQLYRSLRVLPSKLPPKNLPPRHWVVLALKYTQEARQSSGRGWRSGFSYGNSDREYSEWVERMGSGWSSAQHPLYFQRTHSRASFCSRVFNRFLRTREIRVYLTFKPFLYVSLEDNCPLIL